VLVQVFKTLHDWHQQVGKLEILKVNMYVATALEKMFLRILGIDLHWLAMA
jgi:hypothetical protein